MQLSLTHELMHVETVSMQLLATMMNYDSGCGVGRGWGSLGCDCMSWQRSSNSMSRCLLTCSGWMGSDLNLGNLGAGEQARNSPFGPFGLFCMILFRFIFPMMRINLDGGSVRGYTSELMIAKTVAVVGTGGW